MIKILPARLANQIAAGEVVERPASVVKELIENSLDSGATRIEIDIEKGGTKLIRIRDNGSGIPKSELTIALSRHATSKIQTLDDLEAISTLGFRGEALASISSVSRLSLISRPDDQDEAWLAYSEGRDMNVKLQPAAHPVGTTVEVLDLFFNTPARRKFLRTEKTEFTHIDELLKRIALSRFDVDIIVKHNGKIVRQYRSGERITQKEKRLSSVCGTNFVKHMLHIELEHDGLKLFGWITSPDGSRSQSDLQYCYVNGRMMKDRLINHAIRQSYEGTLSSEQYAAYVLFIELDPHQVDVNVHPAKHEVRFHQSRLVHDFIYQTIASVLAENQYVQKPMISEAAFHYECGANITDTQDTNNLPSYSGQINDSSELVDHHLKNEWKDTQSKNPQSFLGKKNKSSPSQSQVKAYSQLMNIDVESGNGLRKDKDLIQDTVHDQCIAPVELNSLGKAISVVQNKYLLMVENGRSFLLSLDRSYLLKLKKQLDPMVDIIKSQPLLIPLTIKCPEEWIHMIEEWLSCLTKLGIELKVRKPETIMLMGVPQPLRQQNLQKLVSDLLSYSFQYVDPNRQESREILSSWLAEYVYGTDKKNDSYTLSEAIQLVSELENLWQGDLPLDDNRLVQPVDFSLTIKALNE